jgi:Uma2 family endonuclease
MATVINPPGHAAQQVVLHNISWETYERLLVEHVGCQSPRFAYDRGELEIMVLSFEHEQFNRLLADVFTAIAVEMNLDFTNAGSTTFKREDLARGFEPDTCFYIQHAERVVRKKRLDLSVDPPPDLVIEIDITSPSLNKLPIYAAVGVTEVWRFDGRRVIILTLVGDAYTEREDSVVMPHVTSSQLTDFLETSQRLPRVAWLRSVRDWAQHRRADNG